MSSQGNGYAFSGLQVRDEGVTLPKRPFLNFVGAGVTVTDDPASGETDVTIPGGGGGGSTTLVLSYRAFATTVLVPATTILVTDFTVDVDPTLAAGTVNLPAAAGFTGQVFAVKHGSASANTVTIDPNGAELIDGLATFVLTTRQSATIQSTGTGWIIL